MTATIASDWIEHDGSECPVGREVWVDIKSRDGEVFTDMPASTWTSVLYSGNCKIENGPDWWKWEPDPFDGNDSDIVAYRISEPSA